MFVPLFPGFLGEVMELRSFRAVFLFNEDGIGYVIDIPIQQFNLQCFLDVADLSLSPIFLPVEQAPDVGCINLDLGLYI